MKITKLMLSAFVAAAALVACNKETHTPEATGVKTVTISLENAVMTKGTYDHELIEAGNKVLFEDFQIFLVGADGTVYPAKTLNNTKEDAPTYFKSMPEGPIQYHYVNPAVTGVVIYANMGRELENVTDVDDIDSSLSIDNEQNPFYLTLYGKDSSLEQKTQETHNGDITIVYEAKVTLAPVISRFEVDGFKIAFENPAKHNSIQINQLAFQNYYPASDVVSGEVSGTIVKPVTDLANDTQVYNYFAANVTAGKDWYWDGFENMVFTPNDDVPYQSVDNTPNDGKTTRLAYHFFSCDALPVMMIHLTVTGTQGDAHPAYLYTDKYVTGTTINETTGEEENVYLTKMLPGYIYRMSADGSVKGEGGYIEIPEDKIEAADRCIDIKVEVVKWNVQLVQPEF